MIANAMSKEASVPEGAPRPVQFPRARRWGGILTAFFSAQSAVQLLGIGAGLLFVNFLSVEEFALYTLANSMLSFFTFASDLGSSSSLIYFYRATAHEPGGFALMFAAVRSLRRAAFIAGALIAAVGLPLTASARGLPLISSLLCTAAVLVAVWFQIESSLGILALRLENQYARSYGAELAGGSLRFLLAAVLVATGLHLAWMAVASAAAATALVALMAKSPRSAVDADLGPQRRRVFRYLLPSLPSAIYFSIQGPLTIWLAASFGGARSIAEVGAISRLGLVLGVFGSLTGVVFLPYLARIADDRLYVRRFLQFGALLTAIGGGLFGAAAVAPGPFLALLGPHYRGLYHELLIVVGTAWLTLLGGYLVGTNLGRAWNRWESLSVAAQIACQVAFIALLDLTTSRGVLIFGLASSVTGLILQTIIATTGFWRPRWVTWNP